MPTWNAGPLLGEVLEAVARQRSAHDLEKVAVDSGSTDGTVPLLKAHGFAVHSIRQAEFNHGATRDLAITRTRAPIVVLLTQDATPANDEWLERLVACYDDPTVGAAYCRQVPRPGCNPILARRLEQWMAGDDSRVVKSIESEQAFLSLSPFERLRVSAYDNVAGSVRRSVWESLRFGQRRFGEDIAFGKRVVLAGLGIAFEPRSVVVHSHDRSAMAEGRRIYCDHANLEDLFALKTVPDPDAREAAIAWGKAHFARIVDEWQGPEQRKDELRVWADQYAWWSAWGQYLGGNARRLLAGPSSAFYRKVDRWMRRGI